ncbi:recombinase RecT [Dyadobacter sp. CY312]|uniref:recombinase RecT n=1 Tax=Dyadobacter sp. CY312 TaxID=2907303 RepID=UPI001F389A19|nr:recombinase RecT [Dyadobacter sp. CY312]MCE7039285.1 recombinase RecT [Dyadobacter sp. CY312]
MSTQLQTTPPAGTTPPVKATKLDRFKVAMKSESIQEQMSNALKENKDSFIASMIDLVSGDSKLMQCDPAALIAEALKAAVLKLPVIKSLGYAWIIPYKKKKKNDQGQWIEYLQPSFQLGYKGYIQLALRSKSVKHINTRAVYEGQFIDEDYLTGAFKFQHKKTSDVIVGYMAHVELHDGFSKTLYSTVDQIKDHAAKYSKSYDPKDAKNIWVVEFDDMALKTVLTDLLSKWVTLSAELQIALSQDRENDQKSFVDEDGKVRSEDANLTSVTFDDVDIVGSKVTQDLPPATEKETVPITVNPNPVTAPRQNAATPPAAEEEEVDDNEAGF